MDSTNNKTNWLAIGASAVAGMVIGFLWYAVLFVKQFMEGNGITMNEDKTIMFKNGVQTQGLSDVASMGLNFLGLVFYAVVLNWLLGRSNARTWKDGAMVGGAIGLISLVAVFINNMFASTSTTLSMVDGSYILVLFTAMGAIIGGWQKR
jgi:uncharacterized membrane protein